MCYTEGKGVLKVLKHWVLTWTSFRWLCHDYRAEWVWAVVKYHQPHPALLIQNYTLPQFTNTGKSARVGLATLHIQCVIQTFIHQTMVVLACGHISIQAMVPNMGQICSSPYQLFILKYTLVLL